MVELLVVVLVIAITLAVALPRINSYLRTYKIQGAAKQLAGDLQTARGKAIMSNTNKGVSFVVLDANSYRFVQEDLLTKTGEEPLSRLVDLPRGIRFVTRAETGAIPSIRFNRLGVYGKPGMATNPCTDPPASCTTAEASRITVDKGSNYFAPDTVVTGGVFVQVREETSGLMRRVVIAPGGRITASRGQGD